MSLENPFRKPPTKPANKDTASFIESVLGEKEGDKARKVIGDTSIQETKPSLEKVDFIHEAGRNIFEQKLDEQLAKDMLTEGDKYLAIVEEKQSKSEPLSRAELFFLYEKFGKITKEKGYRRLVNKIRSQRSFKEDAPIVLECGSDEIAWKQEDVDDKTKAYIGPLFSGVFRLPIEHIYTSFPEGKIIKQTIEIGGKSELQLEEELEKAGIQITDPARYMMRKKEFTTMKEPEPVSIVKLRVADLFGTQDLHTARFGSLDFHSTSDIYQKAEQMGLEFCPAEVGPHFGLACKVESMDGRTAIAMKQMTVSNGQPCAFGLQRLDGRLWLQGNLAHSSTEWVPENEFIFRLGK